MNYGLIAGILFSVIFWLGLVAICRADCEIEAIYLSDGVLSTTVRCVDIEGNETWEIREVKSER